MASLKQIQEELKSQTQIHCGINRITTDQQCHDWGEHNTHFYSQNGSIRRLEQCKKYFKIFKTNAEKPVSKEYSKIQLACTKVITLFYI